MTEPGLMDNLRRFAEKPKQKPSTKRSKFNIDDWVIKNKIPTTGREETKDGKRYIHVTCPNDSNHKDAAIIVGLDGPGYHCFHTGCKSLTWKEYRKLYEPEVEDTDKTSQADLLVATMLNTVTEFFSNGVGDTFARFPVGEVVQVHSVRSSLFKNFLSGLYYRQFDKAVSSEAIRQALGIAESQLVFEYNKKNTKLRCWAATGRIVYDLANDLWQSIEITKEGWKVIPSPPEMIRGANTGTQVMPEPGGDISLLKNILNTKTEDDFTLICVWLAYCIMCPDLPKPLIVLHGSKGAGKSNFQRFLRRLVDPAAAELTRLCASEPENALQAEKNYLLSYDNLSRLTAEQSDFLCTVSTGGAFSKRKHYTDSEEVILKFCRPVTMSGINVVAEKSDLLDRAIMIELDLIPKSERKTESELWELFEKERPKILGAIFDSIVHALGADNKVFEELERMADFNKIGYQIAIGLGFNGEDFLAAFRRNNEKTVDTAIRSDIVAQCLLKYLEGNPRFEGTSSKLHEELNRVACTLRLGRQFPNSTQALTRKLRPMITDLAAVGVTILEGQDKHTHQRHFTITLLKDMTNISSQASQASQTAKPLGLSGEGISESISSRENQVSSQSMFDDTDDDLLSGEF